MSSVIELPAKRALDLIAEHVRERFPNTLDVGAPHVDVVAVVNGLLDELKGHRVLSGDRPPPPAPPDTGVIVR